MAWRGNEDWESQGIVKDSIKSAYYLSIAFLSVTLIVVITLLIGCINWASEKVAKALVGKCKNQQQLLLQDDDRSYCPLGSS